MQERRSMVLDAFRTPLGVLSLIKGGGGPEWIFLPAGPLLHMARFYRSGGQIPRLLPDIPSPLDVTLHYPHLSHLPPGRSPIPLLLSVHGVSTITSFTHEQPLWRLYPQSQTSTSVDRILWSPSPAISPLVARCPLITGLYARCHADRFPASDRPSFE
jgi:hypothetical protein